MVAGVEAYDPHWADRGAELVTDVRAAMAGLPDSCDVAAVDHIGSTSVPGLPAKPFIDLQVAVLPLPSDAALADVLAPLGFVREPGARPDSPGVSSDVPRWDVAAPAEVWRKSLWTRGDPMVAGAVILHVRRADSPWACWAVAFRDWLRAHPAERDAYAAVKQELMAANAGRPDYDDYTRAKTTYFDRVEPLVRAWRDAEQDG
ncbi:GrpB family protein [Nocardioidaceae bacterium]|nr:GrpB family protein [Nocardioidaceae bacterium]